MGAEEWGDLGHSLCNCQNPFSMRNKSQKRGNDGRHQPAGRNISCRDCPAPQMTCLPHAMYRVDTNGDASPITPT